MAHKREVVPGAVTQEFIDLMAQEYRGGSGVYRSRVMGEFPENSDEALCRLDGGVVALALDPARFGPDASALAVRCGEVIEEIVTWNKLSTVETAARVLTVDEPGLGGGVLDVLREMGVRVRGYNGGATPLRVEKFRNCRAESFWGLWRRLERGEIALPPDAKLADELCSMRWSIGLDGRIQIES